MELDTYFIPAEKVEEDAQVERIHLQELERSKEKSSNNDMKIKDERLEIDEYSNLKKVGEICLDENEIPYNISLMKFEYERWCNSDTS